MTHIIIGLAMLAYLYAVEWNARRLERKEKNHAEHH